MSSPDCFTPLSTRLLSSASGDAQFLSSGSGGGGGAACWAPAQDLLAVGTADGGMHLHRLGWARILSMPREAHAGAPTGVCSTTSLAWRPDGKALALACRCGAVSLLSMEARGVAAVWRPAESLGEAAADGAPITCIRWVDSLAPATPAAPSAPRPADAALLQALYLRAQGAAPRGVRAAMQELESSVRLYASGSGGELSASSSSTTSSSLSPERVGHYFDTASLPSPTELEHVLELFHALSLPVGASLPASASANANGGAGAHGHGHKSGRQQASSGGGGPSPLLGGSILHDALDSSSPSSGCPNLLFVGDARGRFWARACGTLDVLAGSVGQGHPILAMDWCGLSGTVSVASRECTAEDASGSTARVAMHLRSLPPLVRHPRALLEVVHQVQQLQSLHSYMHSCLQTMGEQWGPARRSFFNRMAGLSDTVESMKTELAEQRASGGGGGGGGGDAHSDTDEEVDEDDAADLADLDPTTLLLHALLSGVPSPPMHRFISGYLSSGPLGKSLTQVDRALEEGAALLLVALIPAAEQAVFRCEQLRALSHTATATAGAYAELGLDGGACAHLLNRAALFLGGLRDALTELAGVRRGYASFGEWMLALVRLVNDEHEHEDGQDEPEDKDSRPVPVYGPFDTQGIVRFVREEGQVQQDRVGEELLGDLKAETKRAEVAQAKRARGQRQEEEEAVTEAGKDATAASPLSAFVPPCFSPSPSSPSSLAHLFVSFRSALSALMTRPAQAISAQGTQLALDPTSSLDGSLAPATTLLELADPLTRAWIAAPIAAAVGADTPPSALVPLHNLLGTARTLALSHSASLKSCAHRVAFLWTHGPGEQFVSLLRYRSMDVSAALAQAEGVDSSSACAVRPVSHWTVLVPSAPTADDAALAPSPSSSSWSCSVVSVQFYSEQYLMLLVQYERRDKEDAAGADASDMDAAAVPAPATSSSSCCSKLWLIDLDELNSESWVEISSPPPQTSSSSSSSSVQGCIASQIQRGEAPLYSLLPGVRSPFASDADLDALEHVAVSRSRLFPPGQLVGSVALSGVRGLAAVMLAAPRGLPPPPPSSSSSALRAPADQATLLLQGVFKPSRRVLLLDMMEDPEEEEEEDAAGEEEAAAAAEEEEQAEAAAEEEEKADASMTHESTPAGTPAKKSPRSSLGPSTSGSRRSLGSGSPMVLSLLLLLSLLMLLLQLPVVVDASEGDRDASFRYCTDLCRSRCRVLEDASGGWDPFSAAGAQEQLQQWAAAPKESSASSSSSPSGAEEALRIAAIPQPNSLWERAVFRWDCASNCGYNCMHATEYARRESWDRRVQEARASGRDLSISPWNRPFQTWKYYGKWPFQRVWGMQELFSSLFSVANALPHIYWFRRLGREFGSASSSTQQQQLWRPSDLPMLPLWRAYGLVYCNTWLWSTVFHARDTLLTERLDYFCASAGLSFSLALVLIQWIGPHKSFVGGRVRPTLVRVLVFLSVFAGLVAHIGYLQLVHFDYGWNMKVSLGVGIAHSMLWVGHVWRHRKQAYQVRMVWVTLALWMCATLEVFDFPPVAGGLLDAHAIWHGLTPFVGWQFYRWVHDDLTHQAKEAEQENMKRGV